MARNKEENNMKNQRILSAALAVLMAGSLAACGGCRRQHPASDTTDTSSAASASQAAPVDEYKQYKGGDVVLPPIPSLTTSLPLSGRQRHCMGQLLHGASGQKDSGHRR